MVIIDALWPDSTADLDDDQILAAYETDAATSWLRVNFVASVDGSSTVQGRSEGLGNRVDRRVFNLLRRPSDVILVAAGTVRAEGYGGELLGASDRDWREQHGFDPRPRLVIVSGSANLDPELPVFVESPHAPLVFTTAAASVQRRARLEQVAEVVVCGDRDLDLVQARDELSRRGGARVHCEGGPRLAGALAAAGLIDELCLTVSPLLAVGDGSRILLSDSDDDVARPLTLAGVLRGDDTLLLRYTARSRPSMIV